MPHPETVGVRAGIARTEFFETSEALFLNSGYTYATAEDAERAFNGDVERFVYSRYGNPTVAMLEDRLRALQPGAAACTATASGMGAVYTALRAVLRPGDHLVAARSLFGSCYVICEEILPAWGVEVTFVDGRDLDEWADAITSRTRAVFFETPSNPMQHLVDVGAVAALAHAVGAHVVVDHGFLPIGMQHCFDLGADIVVHSATKTADGQGRVMGGAILTATDALMVDTIQPLIKHTGPTLAPFNAWVIGKGLETLALRSRACAQSAHTIAATLRTHPQVSWVRYPHDPSHPQYDLAQRQMTAGGTVITFELASQTTEAKTAAFGFMNALQLIDISNNFGDAKSLIAHPATTTHRAIGADGRAAIGLTDGVLRLSVGLEHTHDLTDDLERALANTTR
ncbi:O-succinylhomoserine sulfhydrylase [Gordonia sp. DT101]|uniref:O-succinylhomoserine sulfhydrylase n=1 Tax=Gordonia sp. DT101 TaxID=3416545 RepID=UPI003CFA6582